MLQGPDCPLKTRLLLHCAAKLMSEASDPAAREEAAAVMAQWEAQLGGGGVDDQLSLAAALYNRNEYGAAAAIYDGLHAQFPDLHALGFYQALCAYMQDDWQGGAAHLAAYQVGAAAQALDGAAKCGSLTMKG